MQISYLVTLFNKAAFLPHLLAGLQAQQGEFARQYVFVDDGSTDDTLQILRDLTASWSGVVIISQANAGPARALNAGLALVEGDYVKPVDGDDMLFPWATRDLLVACETCGTSYAYAPMDLQLRYDVNDPPQCPDYKNIKPVLQKDFLHLALRRAVTNPSVWIARTALLRALGGSDPGVFIQDYSLELRLAASGPAARLDTAVMAMPMVAPGRLSGNDAQTLHDVNLALLRFLRGHPALPAKLRRFGVKRAAGRAWNWARRHGGGSLIKLFGALMAAKLGCLTPDLATEAMLCAPFRGRAVRLCPDN